MGTRGFIGFVAGGQEKIAYNHFDSYPDGLGLKVLGFVRQLVKDQAVDSAAERARQLRVVTDDTPITPEDIKALEGWTNTGVGGRMTPDGIDRSLNWYQLLRETQGDPDAILTAGYLEDGSDFPLDSLSAEWGYVIDFDERVLEVYRGFQTTPATAGRWAGRVQMSDLAQPPDADYYPVQQLVIFEFDALPDDRSFVDLVEAADPHTVADNMVG